MTFAFTQRHRDEYCGDGYTILRGAIPPELLGRLRVEAEKARAIARRQSGEQAQRLQPVWSYPELDHRPFREFLGLDSIRTTAAALLSPAHEASVMGILFEPARTPYSLPWHRDWAYNVPGLDIDRWWTLMNDLTMFNQLNAALYDDSSFWVVPGSHNRDDTDAERGAFATIPPSPPEMTAEMSDSEVETRCLVYCRQMPGAVQVTLNASDVAFYRNSSWHLGRYVPYVKRATLHECFYGAADVAWRNEALAMRQSHEERARA